MALTVSFDTGKRIRFAHSSQAFIAGSITFDSSYDYGGESISAIAGKFKSLKSVVVEGSGGYNFKTDVTSKLIRAFAPAPAIIYEEKHTAVARVVTLNYPAAWIVNVTKATVTQQWTKTGLAEPPANTVCLATAITDGVRTTLTTAGATDVIYVTYVTQAWQELYKCLVQEEAYTAATGNNDLANKMLAFGYNYQTAATATLLKPTDPATAADTGLVGIKFNSATQQVNHHSGQNTKACVITYLKVPTSGFLVDRLVADEDPTKEGADPYTQTFDKPLLLWCISGNIMINNAAPKGFVMEHETPATGFVNTNWGYRGPAGTGATPATGFVVGGKDNVTCTAGAYLFGHPWEINGLVPLEVKSGTDLSGVTVRFSAFGLI